MTSWYNNLLTKTTSQISSLRSTLLSSDADGDTEDDTHVCRVLRNYYADKGRPFPPGCLPTQRPPRPRPPRRSTPSRRSDRDMVASGSRGSSSSKAPAAAR
ncbi:hypothetical protein ACCO45_007837 [Purpureocillium lilacinum]|uniref:Uncharacterized protein n=1 Tax=Purpureocillium lilacinum TaxID=33203 RepID=A0ACC4DLS8_PURLI